MKSRKCGKSAVDYLTFQRHLMYISGCMTVISLLGPLPANTMGKLLIETNAYFAKTTIGNLSVDNILIWGCFLVRINSRTKLSVFRHRQWPSKITHHWVFENNNEIHVVSGVLMYMIAYYFMWRYSRKNSMLEPDRVRNTLMVRGLPRYVEKSGRLRFEQINPGINAPFNPWTPRWELVRNRLLFTRSWN